jgi:hypothetical protein
VRLHPTAFAADENFLCGSKSLRESHSHPKDGYPQRITSAKAVLGTRKLLLRCQSIRECQKHRFLLLHRPETLTADEQEQIDSLCASPIGEQLQVVRAFLVDWYRLWINDDDQRRTLAEAKTQYEAWRASATYQAVPQLRCTQERITSAKFESLSQFLRHPQWEATNNGAERAGRAFRHRQAPHFDLRKKESIANALNVMACLRKGAAMQPPLGPYHTCQRGRKRRDQTNQATYAMAA